MADATSRADGRGPTTAEALGGLAAVLRTIEAQRQTIREWATAAIREVEAQRDDQLSRFDRAVTVLHGGEAALAPADTPSRALAEPSSRLKPRRPSKLATSRRATRERREAVLRYLTEQAEPVAPAQIGHTLQISRHATRTALSHLREGGKVVRVGTGMATRYEAKAGASAASGPASSLDGASGRGTLQGRILATIEDRGWASLDELVQATGASSQEASKACGALVAEEEIRMSRADGRGVFVLQGSA